ncbi:ROK family glucokinase [Bacillus sp. EB600]|uniref:ROK family glucokinase n=1 Tax=Bacillus sp. EB600 TaxID=2806345 RepID=UPI002109F763|nr:ROK family glucokinase [Bacillus sp. EB600]MCQ6278095.1 ROK family glucokinase [Bacillus sp. EB600]
MAEQWIVGVDLGGTTTKVAFINMDGTIIQKWKIPTDNSAEGKFITINIAKTIDQKLEELHTSKEKLIGLGMGAPGPIHYLSGMILNAVNLGWRDNFPLQELLQEETFLPAIIENDANCAALGEMWKGAGNGSKDLVCVTLGTGVGGGVIVNGNIIQGVNGAGGEIGHITAIPFGGHPCNCGKTGCLETVASATGIVRIAMSSLAQESTDGLLQDIFAEKGAITAKDVMDCARNEDLLAQKVIDKIAVYLGLVLANIANTLNPAKIVIGGGVSKAGDVLLKPVIAQFEKFAFEPVRKSTEIALAALGNDAGVIGAAWLVKNKLTKLNS